MGKTLTKAQSRIMDFIRHGIEQDGRPPTYREIMTGLGLASVSTVAVHIDKLVEAGHLRRQPNKGRSLEVVE